MSLHCTIMRLVLLVIGIVVVESQFYSSSIARERLVTELFVHYDSASRPALKGDKLDVQVNMEIQHLDYQEENGAVKILGLLNVRWYDMKLAWNPKDYNNLTRIPVSQKLVWVPDLEVYMNAPDKFLRMHRNGMVLLHHNGSVFWTDTIDITMFCTTNMRNWPHDRHMCKIGLGSWTYDGYDLDIVNAAPNETLNVSNIGTTNMDYKVTNFTADHVATRYSCCEEPYITMDYRLTFERQSAFVVIFRASAFCIILLTLLALGMESHRSEKLWLIGVNLIIIVFHLIYFANSVGKFARGTPLIVTFYSFSFVLVTLAHLTTVFSLFATRSRFRGKLPQRYSKFLKSSLVRLIAPPHESIAKPDQSEFEDVKLQECSNLISNHYSPSEWIQLARMVERAALGIIGLAYVVLATTCFV